MSVRVGYDSTNAADLPGDAHIYPAYVDGRYQTYRAVTHRFPHRIVPRITVTGGTLDAEVIDCETGDASPRTAALWAGHKRKRREVGTIYCNASTRPQVEAACRALGLKLGRDYQLWVAWYTADGSRKIPRGAVGRQWMAPEGIGKSKSPGHFDVSSFRAHWPGVDPPRRRPWWRRRAWR